jgi:hypothetical protein
MEIVEPVACISSTLQFEDGPFLDKNMGKIKMRKRNKYRAVFGQLKKPRKKDHYYIEIVDRYGNLDAMMKSYRLS